MIDTVFEYKGEKYSIKRIEQVDESLKFMIDEFKKTGKDLFYYHATKVLKTGKISAQGGTFLRFTKSGNFIKLF